MPILNYTGKKIVMLGADDLVREVFLPEKKTAEYDETTTTIDFLDGIPIIEVLAIRPSDLPEPVEGTLLIVSRVIRETNRDRDDLVSPSTQVRDSRGRLLGYRCLAKRTQFAFSWSEA